MGLVSEPFLFKGFSVAKIRATAARSAAESPMTPEKPRRLSAKGLPTLLKLTGWGSHFGHAKPSQSEPLPE